MKESELVSILNNYLRKNKLIYANEVRMGIGIPDIVVGCDMPEKHENIVDYYVLKIYSLIIENGINNINQIIELTHLPKVQILKYIHVLEERNIISIDEDIITINKRIDKEPLGINISIEVKVKDWKTGLIQAQRYLSFSDYSYVALPEQNIKYVKSENFFGTGIGLLSISDNDMKEVIPPLKSTKCDYLFKYISISTLLQKCNEVVDNCNKFCSIFSFLSIPC